MIIECENIHESKFRRENVKGVIIFANRSEERHSAPKKFGLPHMRHKYFPGQSMRRRNS